MFYQFTNYKTACARTVKPRDRFWRDCARLTETIERPHSEACLCVRLWNVLSCSLPPARWHSSTLPPPSTHILTHAPSHSKKKERLCDGGAGVNNPDRVSRACTSPAAAAAHGCQPRRYVAHTRDARSSPARRARAGCRTGARLHRRALASVLPPVPYLSRRASSAAADGVLRVLCDAGYVAAGTPWSAASTLPARQPVRQIFWHSTVQAAAASGARSRERLTSRADAT